MISMPLRGHATCRILAGMEKVRLTPDPSIILQLSSMHLRMKRLRHQLSELCVKIFAAEIVCKDGSILVDEHGVRNGMYGIDLGSLTLPSLEV